MCEKCGVTNPGHTEYECPATSIADGALVGPMALLQGINWTGGR